MLFRSDDILEYLRPLEDDVAFVDLAAFTLCKHLLRKQAMLEVQRLNQRARMLLDDLKKEGGLVSSTLQKLCSENLHKMIGGTYQEPVAGVDTNIDSLIQQNLMMLENSYKMNQFNNVYYNCFTSTSQHPSQVVHQPDHGTFRTQPEQTLRRKPCAQGPLI